jgi:hypothetical protein
VRILLSVVLLIVLSAVLVYSWPRPFPSPRLVLNRPYEALARDLGAPADFDPNSKWPPPLRSGKSVAWVKPWPLSKWVLQIDYTATPFNPQAHPDGASRCLETKWEWLNWLPPCEAWFRARVQVP